MKRPNQVRLQKVIADCGITSRRKAEKLIIEGRVSVNGETILELGTKVDPDSDLVSVDNNVVDTAATEKLYIVMNKPRGYMCTMSDPEGRKTVMDLCAGMRSRIYPVGRLDYHSEGLLILTNDGELANKIIHPSSELQKIYEVKVFGNVNEPIMKRLRAGTVGEDGILKADSVRIVKRLPTKTWLEFRLSEGKNREIRRICEAAGLTIDKLKRIAIENIHIEGIAPGKYVYITKPQLLQRLGMTEDGTKITTKKRFQYKTSKKALDIKKRFKSSGKAADSKDYQKYNKANYNDTMKLYKEIAVERKAKHDLENPPGKPMKRGKGQKVENTTAMPANLPIADAKPLNKPSI